MPVHHLDTFKLEEMKYRKIFVSFVRDAKTSVTNVLLDGTHLDWITSYAETQEEFSKDCEQYLASEKYTQAYNRFMGRE